MRLSSVPPGITCDAGSAVKVQGKGSRALSPSKIPFALYEGFDLLRDTIVGRSLEDVCPLVLRFTCLTSSQRSHVQDYVVEYRAILCRATGGHYWRVNRHRLCPGTAIRQQRCTCHSHCQDKEQTRQRCGRAQKGCQSQGWRPKYQSLSSRHHRPLSGSLHGICTCMFQVA